MKVVLVLRHTAYFRFFDRPVRELCRGGHSITLLLEHKHSHDEPDARAKDSPRALLACEAELDNFSWGWAIQRNDKWRKPARTARELINYTSYLKPGRQSSRMVANRSATHLPIFCQWLVRFRAVRAGLLTPRAQRALRAFERLAPPDRSILTWLSEHRPDVVVASPVIMRHSEEVDYVKAAAALGTPTIVAVTSWDHLTTKGVFQIIPDMTLVWNQVQVEEARRLHGVPDEKLRITGAPVFDHWFSMQPTLNRAAFCRRAGLDPDRPFAAYLCSSRSIVQDETEYVEQFAGELRCNPDTRHVSLLGRPYPWHAQMWQQYAGEGITVWPRGGDNPDTPEARQDYYHSLHYSAAVAGINTSGFLDAAILDRPCMTILGERYRDTQQDIAHFQHLLNAGFLETAPTAREAANLLAGLLRGEDCRRENRRRFVREFVRPCGIETPASTIMVKAIEAVARHE